MRAPAFWWRQRLSLPSILLFPTSLLYGAIAGRRMSLHGENAALPVICIGNFTAGGAGKTPTAIAVAELLAASGEFPAFLSRGYGGSESGPLQVGPQHSARRDRRRTASPRSDSARHRLAPSPRPEPGSRSRPAPPPS